MQMCSTTSLKTMVLLLWQKEASDNSDISCKRVKCVTLSFPLTSMEYHDVLPNISSSRMSVDA